MKVLHLTLIRKWFDLIASGEKRGEYREKKEYWRKRLEGRQYDEIHFRNGYATDAPFMRVEFLGIEDAQFQGKECYGLRLGEILELSYGGSQSADHFGGETNSPYRAHRPQAPAACSGRVLPPAG